MITFEPGENFLTAARPIDFIDAGIAEACTFTGVHTFERPEVATDALREYQIITSSDDFPAEYSATLPFSDADITRRKDYLQVIFTPRIGRIAERKTSYVFRDEAGVLEYRAVTKTSSRNSEAYDHVPMSVVRALQVLRLVKRLYEEVPVSA
jgi:hypothetical protein